jgi:non-ribosomal peptide synthetase component F
MYEGCFILRELIEKSFAKHRDRHILPGVTYGEFHNLAEKIKNNLPDEKFIAVVGEKSFELYASVIGVVLSGKTFIPVSLSFNKERIEEILKFTDTVIVAPEAEEFVKKLNINVNLLYVNRMDDKKTSFKIESEYVYMLFTSGSTGKPKAIPITQENLLSYINFVVNKFNINSSDVLSQTFDISFDLSMHDIFTAVLTGAKLVPIPKESLFIPNKIIKREKITVWFSVPSVLVYMDKLRLLNDRFESIRLSLFCGEPLPTYLAKKWKQAVNGEIYNLYGPTEATIAISFFKFRDIDTKIVPIGEIFPTQEYLIRNGELYLSGSQIFNGYLNTDSCPFETINGKKFYKTGDLVKETKYGLEYIGRKDNQIKLNGYRIELEEIETVARENGANSVAVFDEKRNEIVLFTEKEIDLSGYLPSYMVPKRVVLVDKLPLNTNMKFDRKKLKESLWKDS